MAALTDVPNITDTIAAIAALGTAAYGLVDASKALWGGPSRIGFGCIKKALRPFNQALKSLHSAPWETLRSNWLNGVAKADQKATAKALIHLALSPTNAASLAEAVGIDKAALKTAATKIDNGTELSKPDIDILGRFDALVSAILDAGYERAEQEYTDTARMLAALVAVMLAVWAGYLLQNDDICTYLLSKQCFMAILIGAVSTPLAPVAKDLATSLNAAVKAVSSIKR